MPYTATSWSSLRSQLADRLGDPNKIFWVDAELKILTKEALRTFGLCSGFWRERGTFPTVASTVFYDLPTELPSLLSYTVTDRDIIQQLQYHLLESATSQSSWSGTEMFTLDDLSSAIQHRRDQFLADTGIVVNRSIVNVASPPGGRQTLDESIIDVRRAAWLGASPIDYYRPLWRSDERMLTAYDRNWSVDPNTPETFSIMAPPPLELQLAPVPLDAGQLELLTVDSGSDLDPATAATVIDVPDDLTPAVKWGALADLLGYDGNAADVARAIYAESRYQQYVQLARMLPVVISAELNGIPTIPVTLQSLESCEPNWENRSGSPLDLALAAPNLVAINPVPDSVYSVTVDVARKSVLPALDGDFIQIGREQLDMILDYAEHLALFKVAGTEWHQTERQAQNFLIQSLTYNHRISAAAKSSFASSMQSQRQKQDTKRRQEAGGIGALKNG